MGMDSVCVHSRVKRLCSRHRFYRLRAAVMETWHRGERANLSDSGGEGASRFLVLCDVEHGALEKSSKAPLLGRKRVNRPFFSGLNRVLKNCVYSQIWRYKVAIPYKVWVMLKICISQLLYFQKMHKIIQYIYIVKEMYIYYDRGSYLRWQLMIIFITDESVDHVLDEKGPLHLLLVNVVKHHVWWAEDVLSVCLSEGFRFATLEKQRRSSHCRSCKPNSFSSTSMKKHDLNHSSKIIAASFSVNLLFDWLTYYCSSYFLRVAPPPCYAESWQWEKSRQSDILCRQCRSSFCQITNRFG